GVDWYGISQEPEIYALISVADEFCQASHVRFDEKLKTDSDPISLKNKDIPARSLLSTIYELGVGLIDINQFTDRNRIKEGSFSFVEKAL
ncbi:17743_t:CDS:2, partial [Gigaspora margarita]